MTHIYQQILDAKKQNKKLLAVLIDPDKMDIALVPQFIENVNTSVATHIFVGGSEVAPHATNVLVKTIKQHTKLPVVLFPGDITQIAPSADALLFLSLISGRNAAYLIGKHVKAVPLLNNTNLEILPTGYILVAPDNHTLNKISAVQRVTGTTPICGSNIQEIANTAKAGQLLGMKLIYLEAGSGALQPISQALITTVKACITVPLIVGGGIKSVQQLQAAYQSGADLVVIGTAFETDETFFSELQKPNL
ncbi:geranylgeranylglyceryl/heptaprenylglyceryl phosphate synthase [Bizionia sediminis]|uniref:Geranylgeranylglyceryl phosphate synthase n=1 Tax=Bizionia sediminis TaxID=1737064 RepID=A0ABW5KQB4_9FLAO